MALDTETRRLDQEILAFIRAGFHGPRDDARFNALALRLFAYQFQRNQVYGNFCRARGATPSTVRHWTAIPAVPTLAFKELALACFPIQRAAAVYHSSGTSGHTPSRHYLETLDLYDASLLESFQACVLPERRPMPMFILAPPSRLLPHSSLSHMLEVVKARLGAPGSAFYVDGTGLQREALAAALAAVQRHGAPVCLLGTVFAFIHFLDWCAAEGRRFPLPPGSRIMDTGGYKGKSREVSRHDLHRLYEATFAVPASHVVNEYGMSELSSQSYDTSLVQSVYPGPRRKIGPPWSRTVVVDPETLAPAPEDAAGILRHYDLANRSSVMALQTDDLGVQVGDGFEVLGRAQGAEARGCSIAMDELLAAITGPEGPGARAVQRGGSAFRPTAH